MGSGNHVAVVELSSDEEEIDTRVDMDYFNWLNDVMEAIDEKSDSTDVIEVLSEVKGSVDSQYWKPNSWNQALIDDDDDCVILDGDPEKTAAFEDNDKLAKNVDNDDDDDDVLVVGQKGEIACRDFPHPRHSCAKYSFNSTSHDKYCDMCHCYVCDIPAPCSYWCIVGVSSLNHCHANDKENIWKNQRQYFRTGIMPAEPSSKPTPNILRVSQNSLPWNQGGIRPCSSSTHVVNLSNSRARYRTRQSTPHNQVLQSQPMQSLSSVRNSAIRKDRSPCMLKNPRARVASSAATGNNIGIGLYNNAQVSQSTHHGPVIVAASINSELYTQQRSYHPNVTDHCSPVLGSQGNVYTTYSNQTVSGSGNCQFQTNVGLFAPPETHFAASSQAETVQQQPVTNENVLETKLSELENWLIDNSSQTGPVSTLPEAVNEDYTGSLTFDFETFLNN